MNKGLYSKLAFEGIKKNKKLYIPYIISIIGMVTIMYMLGYFTDSPSLETMKGGSNIGMIMILGQFVMGVFSFFFLFYTNSFLVKRRNSEFALYNILGMNKKNIIKILLRESFFIGLTGISVGLLLGILLSKFFEIVLIKMLGMSPDFVMHFSVEGALVAVLFYVVLLFVLFISSSVKIAVKKPVDLLKSKNYGEKEPKCNWLMTAIGLVLLGVAYYTALSINSPAGALTLFFFAVILVIAATYLLFISGSVFLCKVLKKNKNFYYTSKHFVSLSGMTYRMKRNGAGLASICILSTMVLVMISSAGSLYLGQNASLQSLYPAQIQVRTSLDEMTDEDEIDERIHFVNETINNVIEKENRVDEREFQYIMFPASMKEGKISIESFNDMDPMDDICTVMLASMDDYNRYGEKISLSENETYINTEGWRYKGETIEIDGHIYDIVGKADKRLALGNMEAMNCIVMYVDNFDYVKDDLLKDYPEIVCYYHNVNFNTELSEEEQIPVCDNLKVSLLGVSNVLARSAASADLVNMYASLFVLGIFLSIAFMGACVLIMYYKQLTEGYEDANSYHIMRNVGMTKAEIKRSVNSQTLVTFFSPLVVAGIHLTFSGPMVRLILSILGFNNVFSFVMAYAGCFILFALFYFTVYKKTVKAYVDIVSY